MHRVPSLFCLATALALAGCNSREATAPAVHNPRAGHKH